MNLKSMMYVVIAIVVVALVGTLLTAKDEPKTDDTITCIVSGETIAKSDAKGPVNYDGKNYYFCCNSCLKKFEADPAKFAAKADELKTLCCAGMAVDSKTAIKSTYKGKDYYFCNEKCQAKFDKDPEAYLKMVETAKTHAGCAKAADCAAKCGAENAKACSEKKE